MRPGYIANGRPVLAEYLKVAVISIIIIIITIIVVIVIIVVIMVMEKWEVVFGNHQVRILVPAGNREHYSHH